MKRRSMRTLTLQAAADRTGLSTERLRRAAVEDGEIAYFREPTGAGKSLRGRIFLLETSLETWFFAHVTPARLGPGEAVLESDAPIVEDVDAALLAQTPDEDRFV